MKILLLILLPFKLCASTLFLPDSDTAALVALVSNTASSAANTLKILEVAKKTSDKIDKVNFEVMKRFYLLQRIERHVIDLKLASKIKPKDLAQLNRLMLSIKNNLIGIRSALDQYAEDLTGQQRYLESIGKKLVNSKQDISDAQILDKIASSGGSTAKHAQATAINTAYQAQIFAKIRNDNLSYQNLMVQAKNSEIEQKVREETIMREWAGDRSGSYR